jgi:hypothetical protein
MMLGSTRAANSMDAHVSVLIAVDTSIRLEEKLALTTVTVTALTAVKHYATMTIGPMAFVTTAELIAREPAVTTLRMTTAQRAV